MSINRAEPLLPAYAPEAQKDEKVDAQAPFVTTLAHTAADPFRLLVEAVKDYGIYMLDPAGKVVSWNPAAEKIKGYKAEEILGRHFSCFYTADDVAAGVPQRGLQTALEEGRFEEEGRRVKKGGTPFWVIVTITEMHDAFGNHIGFANVTRDITERRRSEEQLRDAEVRMRSIVNNLIDGIITIDEDGTVVAYNRAAENMFGYTTAEVVGNNVQMLMPESFNTENDSYLTNDMRVGETEIVGGTGREVVGRRKDGSTFPVDFAVSAFHLGQRRHFTGIVRDISQRKRSEEALRVLNAERATKDEAIRGSEERLRNITANIDQVLWMIDAREAKLIYVSQAYERVFGRSCQSLLEYPQAYMEGIHPLDQELIQRTSVETFKTGYVDVEIRILRPDRSLRWIRIKGNPILEQGRIVRLVGIIDDVTEKRRLAEEREGLLARLRLHVERMPIAYVLVDGEMRIVDWNPAAERMFGYSKTEMLGNGPPHEKLIPESSRAKVEAIRHRIRAGDMDASSIHENLTKDGRTIICQWLNTPLMDAAGKFDGYLSLAQDITVRRELEDQVCRAQDRLRHLVASSPAVLFTLAMAGDQIHGISWISDNLLDIFGHPPETALDPNWWMDNIHPEDRDRIIKETHADLLSLGRTDHEYRFRHGDGLYRWTRGELRLMRQGTIAEAEVVGAWSDITEHKHLEGQFRQAQKLEAIGKLAGGIAHDFNNLLTVINCFGEMAMAGLPADDPAHRMIEQVVAAGFRAAGLTRQLLAFSRKAIIEPKIVDLKVVAAGVEPMLRRLIGEDIEMTIISDADVGAVKADPGQIEQIIMNLVVNAGDAMPEGGRITIEVRNAVLEESYARDHVNVQAGPHVFLAVSDTGCGMDEATLANIFEPFFSTKGDQGTGLGLATVHGIVKQSGGHIGVYSEVGHGTTIKVYLPRVDDCPLGQTPPQQGEVVNCGIETVLFVEDQDAVRELGMEILQDCGYTVLGARDGIEALQVAEQHPGQIDIVVSDVVMPRMGGREVAERLATIRPNARVLFLSGYTDDTVVRHGILEAQVTFLQKPFTPASLAKKVREVLDKKTVGTT